MGAGARPGWGGGGDGDPGEMGQAGNLNSSGPLTGLFHSRYDTIDTNSWPTAILARNLLF